MRDNLVIIALMW